MTIPYGKIMNETLLNNILKYFKYCLVGGTGAIIDFVLYGSIIYVFNANYLISNMFSFTTSTLVVFYLQKNWTFQYSTDKNLKTFNRYFQAVIVTYILNNIILIILIELMSFDLLISKVLQILISFLWGYNINKYYVFNKKFD